MTIENKPMLSQTDKQDQTINLIILKNQRDLKICSSVILLTIKHKQCLYNKILVLMG